ncbi:MAG TPA: DUF58 domain-containing protein, partial [Kofleriaceae bacterium]|nr:DUF58 domain-containing protein [Kofleriaceae bacterium]
MLFIVGIPVSLAGVSIDAKLWTVWLCYVAAAILLTGMDAVLALPKRRMRVTVEAPGQVFIGETTPAKLHVSVPGARTARVGVLPELASDFAQQAETWVTLAPDGERSGFAHEIPLAPRRRGEHAIAAVHLRWRGPFGFIEKRLAKPLGTKVAVVPNIGAVRAVALRMFADQSFMAGLKVERFLGDGSEFESLREFVIGLDHRAMDWKASARHRKLLCQEFRAERNHQVVLAVDAGQLMSEPVGGVPKLDHAINASLLLGWFCLRTGDRVGLVGFDERVR